MSKIIGIDLGVACARDGVSLSYGKLRYYGVGWL